MRAYAVTQGQNFDELLSAAARFVSGPISPVLSLSPSELQLLVEDDIASLD
jgi:hypothetical protein